MAKEKGEPTWNDQLINMGMSQKSIDDMTFHPGDHDFFLAMNETFKDALTADIVEILENNNETINKDIAEIIITQNERFSTVISEIMKAIERVSVSIKEVKTDMAIMKVDNDRVHEELRDSFKKLMFRNNYWMILLRLIATGIVMFFVIKYAHDRWWIPAPVLSFFGL
jgi:hypothetical protein